jgi:hypothetical protein
LNKCNTETGSRAILCGVCGVEKVSQEEADELEGHGDHAVPDKGKDRANREAFYVDVVGPTEARCKNRCFPVRGCCICGCLFVRLHTVSITYSESTLGQLTGGCSSIFSPLSGFALRFANTPSDPDPPPYTLVEVGVKTGRIVGRLTIGGGTGVPFIVGSVVICSVDDEAGVPRISRCLSSPSFSSSLSDPSASNVSARFWSTGEASCKRCLEVGEEALDRKEGGGEDGVGLIGESSLLDT